MNKVWLIGRLTAKAELRYTQSNNALIKFNLAVNRNFKNSQGEYETDFISCICFNKQAENVCNFLDKGSLVSIEGRIQTGSYDGQDGTKRYTFDVIVDNIQFLESKKSKQQLSEPNVQVDKQQDPYAEFGEQATINDDFLD